ncbi:hypothetical protein ACWDWT_01250 [Streptomyces sp. NPDC003343]|uniref:hypothetical protein n=1 Tax=Streptomyces sp. EKR5.2 TaxID=3461014 RepID=UPI0040431853
MFLVAIRFKALMRLGVLALVALGIAAITCGWVLPKLRPVVERPRTYGKGALLLALSFFLMGRVIELFTDPIPGLGPLAGAVPLFLGCVAIGLSRRSEAADVQELDKS